MQSLLAHRLQTLGSPCYGGNGANDAPSVQVSLKLRLSSSAGESKRAHQSNGVLLVGEQGIRGSSLGTSFMGKSLPVVSSPSPTARESVTAKTPITTASADKIRPLKVIISGAPASGKGTQCEDIVKKYGLTHISAGDLLRAEVAAGTEYGKKVKSYMDSGNLVPDEVVINIVKSRLAQPDAQEHGWLLDGYPRSASQAAALEAAGIEPEVFILLDVPDEILVERVVGRRLDPVTGKIYHLKFSPPENDTIAARLTQRSDDTEDKVKTRLKTHKENVDSVLSTYKDIISTVDGNRTKDAVFADIDKILSELQAKPQEETDGEGRRSASRSKESWRGIPTRLNSIPHGREIRQYFYKDACQATKNAVEAGLSRLKVVLTIPELNPEMDVYRIGTLLELMREMAFTFAIDGKRVKVCVQGAMGSGVFTGMPLALAGTRRLLELMDWGELYGPLGTFISLGSVGAAEVKEEDDIFIIMAPQNAVGNCIIDDLEAMAEAAGKRPFIIVNPRLKDLPGAGGVMQIGGRETRLEFGASFFPCYHFRLLYTSGTQYPIMGALRSAYPKGYEVFRRVDYGFGEEKYELLATLEEEPSPSDLRDTFEGRTKRPEPTGFWGVVSKILLS